MEFGGVCELHARAEAYLPLVLSCVGCRDPYLLVDTRFRIGSFIIGSFNLYSIMCFRVCEFSPYERNEFERIGLRRCFICAYNVMLSHVRITLCYPFSS